MRHERQREARANAFSRRTRTIPIARSPVNLGTDNLELIDRLVHGDRSAVSTALLAIAGMGAGEAVRRAVLDRIAAAASWACSEGAISSQRAGQIARHVSRALAEHARRPRGGLDGGRDRDAAGATRWSKRTAGLRMEVLALG